MRPHANRFAGTYPRSQSCASGRGKHERESARFALRVFQLNLSPAYRVPRRLDAKETVGKVGHNPRGAAPQCFYLHRAHGTGR